MKENSIKKLKYELEAKNMGCYIDDYDRYDYYRKTQQGLLFIILMCMFIIGTLFGSAILLGW